MASPPLTSREYAYLKITGEGSFLVISEALGLEPTNAWNKGDINRKNGRLRNLTSWQLESGLDDRCSIDEHLNALVLLLEPVEKKLYQLSSQYDICVQCVGYFPPASHGINIDNKMVRFASRIGGSIDFDFYFVDDFGHDLDFV